ncbi:FlgO family outer membrane protein [Alteromonas sp. 1_MG-2023]|jgi:TolB-like protein|uniref:FlgO family outer membrane protein n=1 Tax=Alteromonas sp. 1_MG-2023 TaxID=3062669 RepID=UPI0026E31F4B|nr:FlgO family outer membrane protein [Alteromonas sp. 1_MG-2023]MDO6568720.1 FlgO family outer membrane protein [Alteromonas sp. 1_MG-2023]
MKRLVALLALGLAVNLAACSSTESIGSFWLGDDGELSHSAEPVAVPSGSGLEYSPDSRDREYQQHVAVDPGYRDPMHQGFSPSQTHKRLNDYASQLAMELMDNATRLTQQDMVGVTSFVRLNTSLGDSTVLGNQLSEYLIAELQDFGLAIVDFKMADGVTVTPYGDFVLSRKATSLAKQVSMDHVVTGTIIEDDRGVRVNARIVSMQNKQVVASANIYIPAFIVTDLNKGLTAQVPVE